MTRSRRLAAALTATAIGFAGCGGDDAMKETATTQAILIRLDLDRPSGGVLSGSRIGGSALCPDARTVSRRVGDTTVTKLRCQDGALTIAFPSSHRRACWHVLSATRRFAGLAGSGEMKVHNGRATFAGTVVI